MVSFWNFHLAVLKIMVLNLHSGGKISDIRVLISIPVDTYSIYIFKD